MLIKKLQEIDSMEGEKGTTIHQIFHPHNTLNGIRFSISHSTLSCGKKSRLHKMKTSEIYYILEGEGKIHLDDQSLPISKDQAIYVPPLSKQYIENTGDSELNFLCIVDPAWRREDEILLE